MKLSATFLAALFGTSEANVSCQNGKNLFEASCDSNGFLIKINQACRAEGFSGIDFPNSFVWGSSDQKTLVNPNCAADSCTYADVTATGSGTCSAVKPVTGKQDADGADTHSWTVPLNECGVTGTFDDINNVWKYDLYFNSNSVANTANNIVQMNQVKFTCSLQSFQQDVANGVVISDGSLVADPTEEVINLRDQVELKISTRSGNDVVNSVAGIAFDGNAAMLDGMTADATTANIGDHVELRLQEKDGQNPFNAFSLSLIKCWASKDPKTSAAGEETISGSDTALELKLWDNFCPLFDWVAPESGADTGSGYLKKYWNRESSIHAINFRQFAFLNDFNLGSDSLYYHCHIKVCPKNEETTCSKKDMANVENICTAPTYYSAAQAASSGTQRKRRDNIITRRQSDLDGSTSFEIVQKVSTPDVAREDCQTIDGNVCIVKKDQRAETTSGSTSNTTNDKDNSSAVVAGTSLAAFIALLNLH